MKSGFTLVELLVVLCLLFLLGVILTPAIRGESRKPTSEVKCKQNQRYVIATLLQFKDDHNWRFPSEADFKTGDLLWVGGAVTNNPGTLDLARPLAPYMKSPEFFECPRDTGTSAFDQPKHCYTAWGTSYLWAAKDIPEVGITGMLGRKYTDPLLAASSLKIMTFEPTLCATQRPLPEKDQWHGPSPGGFISFLDGHVDMVKQAPPQTEPMTEAGFSRLAKEKRPYY